MRCHYCNDPIGKGRSHDITVKAWDTGELVTRSFCCGACIADWKREGGEGKAGPAALRAMFRIG
jgi:hypothetical protein